MNSSLYSLDRGTHLKIVLMALLIAILAAMSLGVQANQRMKAHSIRGIAPLHSQHLLVPRPPFVKRPEVALVKAA